MIRPHTPRRTRTQDQKDLRIGIINPQRLITADANTLILLSLSGA
jgi:hypothetical protein